MLTTYFNQVPIAASVFLGKAFHLHVKNTARVAEAAKIDEMLEPTNGNIKWSMSMLCMCALIGLLAGTVGGMLGLGGGFILAPVYLEMGVPPEVLTSYNKLSNTQAHMHTRRR